jgi:hypothetical protein
MQLTIFWCIDLPLHVPRLAQFTFPHLEHCQSSAANRPLLFSAAFFPISTPVFFLPSGPPGRSALQRLQAVRRAKFIFPHLINKKGLSLAKNF